MWLWGLTALVPVVIMHLLRTRRREKEEPSVLLWKSLLKEGGGPGAGKRRPPWDLLLSILFTLTVVLAAAGPALRTVEPRPRKVLFVLDRTASMKCPTPAGETRYEAALRLVREEASQLHPGDQIVLRAHPPFPEGDILASAGELSDLLPDLPGPTDIPGSWEEALRLSLPPGETDRPRVIAFSDGTRMSPGIPPEVALRFVGGPLANAGLVGLGSARTGSGREIFVRVANFSPGFRRIPVALREGPGGDVLSRTVLPVPAGGTAVHVFAEKLARLASVDVLEIRLEADDAFPADDAVYAVRRGRAALTASFEGADAPFLRSALRATGRIRFDGRTGRQRSQPEVRVYHRAAPSGIAGAPSVVVDPSSGWHGLRLSREKTPPSGARYEAADAARKILGRLAPRIRAARYRSLRPVEGHSLTPVLMLGEEIVAGLLKSEMPGQEAPVFVLALPVDRSDGPWVLEPVFPLFWAAVLEDILPLPMPADPGDAEYVFDRTGEAVVPPAGEGSVRVILPDGEERVLSGRPAALDLSQAGLYRVRAPGTGPDTLLAANLLNPAESRAGGSGLRRGVLARTAADADPQGGFLRLGPWLCFLSLAVLCALLGPFLRTGGAGAALLLCLVLCPGCGKKGKTEEPAPLGPGRKVEVKAPEAPEKGTPCKTCSRPSGRDHVCGFSRLCDACGRERSQTAHACGISSFCPACRRERSRLEHRCGETAFCPECRSEEPLHHECFKRLGLWGKGEKKKK
jgi:hypothetical protein